MDSSSNIISDSAAPPPKIGVIMTTKPLTVDTSVSPVNINKNSSDDAEVTLAMSTSISPGDSNYHGSDSEEFEANTPAAAAETTNVSSFNKNSTSVTPSKTSARSKEALPLPPEKNAPPSVSRLNRFLTPRKVKQTLKLESLFHSGNPNVPSPPKFHGMVVDMSIEAVEKRMREWIKIPLVSLAPEAYTKLAFAIGKGLDKVIIKEEGWINATKTALCLVDEKSEIGKRFATVYRSDGDVTGISPPDQEGGECWFAAHIAKHHTKFNTANNANTYNVFKDPDHGNMELFRRGQEWGNCHWQGPVLLHWYLQLWQDPNQDPDSVRMIHLSKYIRNTYSGELLYEHVIKGAAADSFENAEKIMPEAFEDFACIPRTVSSKPFEKWVELLKKYGPGLAEMRHLFKEIQTSGRMTYEGKPCGEETIGGHGLVLVGVRNESVFALLSRSERANDRTQSEAVNGSGGYTVIEGGNQPSADDDGCSHPATEVYFLLQNYWPDKPLLEIRQDYFFASEGKIGFISNRVNPAVDAAYSARTHKVRYAVTSPSLEVPNRRKLKAVWPPNDE